MADNDSPSTVTGSQPLVPARRSSEPGQELASVVGPYASPHVVSRSPEVVSGGVDPASLWHAFRRRWLLATMMGLFLAAGMGALLYWLFPVSNTAKAVYVVRSEQPVILGSMEGTSTDYDVFRASQLAAIRSPRVLQGAIQSPKIRGAQIPFLDSEEDKVAFLAENLDVRFEGDSEYMSVGLSLNQEGKQLAAVVDAVCDAYQTIVVDQAQLNRTAVKDALSRTAANLNTEIKALIDEATQLRKDLNLTEGGALDTETRLILQEITMKLDERSTVQTRLQEGYLQFLTYQRSQASPIIKDAMIEQQLAADPNISQMRQEVMAKQYEIRQAQSRLKQGTSREVTRLESQLAKIQQELQSYEAQTRAQIAQANEGKPDPNNTMMSLQYQTQAAMADARLKQLDTDIADLRDKLDARGEKSSDLLVREAEIEQKQALAQDIARRLEGWEIELSAENRVQLMEQAVVFPGINKTTQYAISGAGALATLGLVCLGIAYLEFMNRKLNGPQQVDEGLGIRVVGTLPGLRGRLSAKHPLIAQLSESIDSVRTALMHESTHKRRQVVLVTSPATREGRTTVASQLAASLARAGRRTLLMDADIRSPSLHKLFGEPLEDGLCEVLRAEAEISDVIRPTESDGLWLLTSGYCDADAVHAMATDQLQPIFDKLRADYDFIIIDGAPVLGLSDSLMIGQHCDGALLSVLRDQTQVPKIYQAAELLRSVGIRLIGSVVNGVKGSADRRITRLHSATPKAERKQLESIK